MRSTHQYGLSTSSVKSSHALDHARAAYRASSATGRHEIMALVLLVQPGRAAVSCAAGINY